MALGFILNNWKLFLTVLLAAVVLLLSIIIGINKGINIAQSRNISANAAELEKGVKFFFKDQDRFPTAVEYSSPSIMLTYFNYFPPKEFPKSHCLQSFVYKRSNSKNAEIGFCLPNATNEFAGGWNSIKLSK
jgi:hypothetical protein